MRLTLGLITAITALAASGCVIDQDADDRPSRPGELGAGDFLYVCVGDADPLCAQGSVAETFPERIAVGGRFALDFNPNDTIFNDGVGLRIEAPNQTLVREELGAFSIEQAGHQVFLAVSNESEVIDLQHILAADIERISVRTMDSQDLDTIELALGESITVFAVPQDRLRSTLAGSLDYAWSTAAPEIAEVVTIDEDFDVTIEALSEGVTTLVIEAGGFTQEVMVEVTVDGPTTEPDPETDTDSGTDTDGGSDSGAETGTDTDTDSDTDTDGSTGA
ncbi:MAG: hypothetical protein ACRBN8_22730 [Nannocystales bacterium]